MPATTARRIAVQAPLGFGAGLPLYLTSATLTTWLADVGVSIEAVGLLALVSLPYNVKFLWAPVLDRFALPFLGRRRGWILTLQLACVAAIASLAWWGTAALERQGTSAVAAVAALALALAALSASQDIVVDAYRADVLGAGERGKGSAAYVAGYRLALIAGGSGALLVADAVSWRAAYLGVAALVAVGVVGVGLAPRVTRVRQPDTMGEAVVAPIRELAARPGAALAIAFILLYKFGDALATPLIGPFLLDVGFSKAEIGLYQKGLGMAATILGAGVGGALADRIGVIRALIGFGILQAAANAGYLALAITGDSAATLVAAIAIDNLCNGLGTAAFVAFLMALCHRRFSATQYALFTSLSSVLGRIAGAGAGYAIAAIGWIGFFAATIAVAAPAVLIARWIDPRVLPTRTDGADDTDGADAGDADDADVPDDGPPPITPRGR